MWRPSKRDAAISVVLMISFVFGLVAGAADPAGDEDYAISLSDLLENKAGVDMLRERRTSAPPDGKWTLGLGVLSNMQQFFDNLKSNLDGLEALPKDERDALLGKALVMAEQDKTFRPRATAAYLHALRNHRPSHKLRNFVDDSDISNYRGANNYDPNLLWSGLGKRR